MHYLSIASLIPKGSRVFLNFASNNLISSLFFDLFDLIYLTSGSLFKHLSIEIIYNF